MMSFSYIISPHIRNPLIGGSGEYGMSRKCGRALRGLSMPEFRDLYGTEAKCARALARQRWPDGFRCARCEGRRHSVFERGNRTYWQCSGCRHQTTVISGTIFQGTKLPLTGWFLAMHLLTQAKNNIAALELARHLGVSYKTAWTVKHKLLHVMMQQENKRVLTGHVEIAPMHFQRDRARAATAGFIAAVQADEARQPRYIKLEPCEPTRSAVSEWISTNCRDAESVRCSAIAPGAKRTRPEDRLRRAIERRAQRTDVRWINSVVGSLKSGIASIYRGIDHNKYGRRYLAEAQYRFNRRNAAGCGVTQLAAAAIRTDPCSLPRLKAAEADP
jgi:hypothetical protein